MPHCQADNNAYTRTPPALPGLAEGCFYPPSYRARPNAHCPCDGQSSASASVLKTSPNPGNAWTARMEAAREGYSSSCRLFRGFEGPPSKRVGLSVAKNF
ncbi:unnamed protein product [Protopolystoma xenopodis]|uniref:Uncharacterized protein n=1 Tax=Protopolystoma xenopodis TaxID=117903 RepID=A0A448WDP8_9PLAT|nr:unnamed protein product [Protopolystoma xenopodis]